MWSSVPRDEGCGHQSPRDEGCGHQSPEVRAWSHPQRCGGVVTAPLRNGRIYIYFTFEVYCAILTILSLMSVANCP